MYYGIHKNDKDCDSFNFYASQCRIRIEMAFGLMQMKWGILWRPVRVKLDNVKYVILSIAILHNFVINERLINNETPEEVGIGRDRPYNPSDCAADNDRNEELIQLHLKSVSVMRDSMVERIVELGLKRPKNNVLNNNDD